MNKEPCLEPELTSVFHLIEKIMSGNQSKVAEASVHLVRHSSEEERIKTLVGAIGLIAMGMNLLQQNVCKTLAKINEVLT